MSRRLPLVAFGFGAGGIAVHTQQAQPDLVLTAISVGVVIASFIVGHMTGQMAEWKKRASRGGTGSAAMGTDPTTWPPSPTRAAIRAARQAAGLTQRQAGALVYRSPEVWASWERGRRPLDAALWELWQLRAADPDWLARLK